MGGAAGGGMLGPLAGLGVAGLGLATGGFGLAAAPGLMAAAPYALAAGGLAMSAVGSVQSAQAQAEQAKYQSEIAARNQQVAQNNAQLASEQGVQNAEIQDIKNKQAMGALIAQQGASGVDVNTGSNVAVQESQDITGQRESGNVNWNSALQTYGYLNQEGNFAAQSGADTVSQKAYESSIPGTAIGGVLSGAGGIMMKGGNFNFGGSSVSSTGDSLTAASNSPSSGFSSPAFASGSSSSNYSFFNP